ncbi:hypothetical protein HOH51_01300 [bacterium]|nr:hypothetical protein [bacterium]
MYIEILGVIGMLLILVAFTMNQLQKWTHESLAYDLVNFLGSVLLVYYAFVLQSVPFIVLNLVWALVSLKDLCIFAKLKK